MSKDEAINAIIDAKTYVLSLVSGDNTEDSFPDVVSDTLYIQHSIDLVTQQREEEAVAVLQSLVKKFNRKAGSTSFWSGEWTDSPHTDTENYLGASKNLQRAISILKP